MYISHSYKNCKMCICVLHIYVYILDYSLSLKGDWEFSNCSIFFKLRMSSFHFLQPVWCSQQRNGIKSAAQLKHSSKTAHVHSQIEKKQKRFASGNPLPNPCVPLCSCVFQTPSLIFGTFFNTRSKMVLLLQTFPSKRTPRISAKNDPGTTCFPRSPKSSAWALASAHPSIADSTRRSCGLAMAGHGWDSRVMG